MKANDKEDEMTTDRLRELAYLVAAELQTQPGWDSDAIEVRDTFDSMVDAALSDEEDALILEEWLA